MDQGPLVIEEIDAGERLVRAFDEYEPVKAAFWLKASDEEQRYLYLASDGIDDTNFDVAYGEVLRLANQMRSPYLDPFRVKLISGQDPLAQSAVDINRRFRGPIATRFGGKSFGGLSVDDVYIYPSPLPAAATST
ncbi:MAG: hypothetical protein P4L84_02585 [Isosphaeraceae bacterium]|nr:hypothetical protein [Isosphaeraceae bacterium]